MQIDRDLLQYCKDKNFPMNKMSDKDFRKVENSLEYSFHKLGLALKKLIGNLGLEKIILNLIKKSEK